MSNSYFSEKDKILYVKNQSDVSIDKMVLALKAIIENKDYPRRLKILEDAIDVRAAFNFNDLEKLKPGIEEVKKKYDQIVHAVVQNNPINVAYAKYMEIYLKDDTKYHFKVFSTIEAADEWVKQF
jgi:hypothetical protein